jgi:hypothetical protein
MSFAITSNPIAVWMEVKTVTLKMTLMLMTTTMMKRMGNLWLTELAIHGAKLSLHLASNNNLITSNNNILEFSW